MSYWTSCQGWTSDHPVLKHHNLVLFDEKTSVLEFDILTTSGFPNNASAPSDPKYYSSRQDQQGIHRYILLPFSG